MRKTGFLLVDGAEALGRAPAKPRHWLAAFLIVIVAQWLYWQCYPLAQMLGFWWTSRGTIGATADQMGAAHVASVLIYLTLPSLLVALLALFVSHRTDKRSAGAIGLDFMTVPTALVWAFAGCVAALPVLTAVAMSGADFRAIAQGAGILTPITIVQAGAEEIVFRGIILASLAARYGVRTGLLASALLFGFWHLSFGQSPFDAVVQFGATFVFGLTAGIVTLHYGNLGPALALHVVWNVAGYLYAGTANWETDFWLGWVQGIDRPWLPEDLQSGVLMQFLIAPLVIETLLVFAACRETVARLVDVRRAAFA